MQHSWRTAREADIQRHAVCRNVGGTGQRRARSKSPRPRRRGRRCIGMQAGLQLQLTSTEHLRDLSPRHHTASSQAREQPADRAMQEQWQAP